MNCRFHSIVLFVLIFILPLMLCADDDASPTIVLVVGVAGAPEYEEQFSEWADRWSQVASQAEAGYHEIGRGDDEAVTDRDRLRKVLENEASSSSEPLWLVMIGHGTFFRDVAKFNLRGADVTATELAGWVAPLARPLVVVNCASSSGPFINRLSGPRRTVITSTKSGEEQNFSRFGAYFSQAITDTSADLDHDDEVSLLEAFLSASKRVAMFYQQEGRLATEQALIDDNGDHAGTPASFFRGVRAQVEAKGGKSVDGLAAGRIHLLPDPQGLAWLPDERVERAAIEDSIETLRTRKSQLAVEQYYREMEILLVRMAQLYARVDARNASESVTGEAKD